MVHTGWISLGCASANLLAAFQGNLMCFVECTFLLRPTQLKVVKFGPHTRQGSQKKPIALEEVVFSVDGGDEPRMEHSETDLLEHPRDANASMNSEDELNEGLAGFVLLWGWRSSPFVALVGSFCNGSRCTAGVFCACNNMTYLLTVVRGHSGLVYVMLQVSCTRPCWKVHD